MSRPANRRALVTGAASGIGLEVCRRLAGEGAAVAMLDVNEGALRAAAAQLGGSAHPIAGDVTSASDVRGAVARATQALGGLDTVVICAGIIHVKPLAEVTEEDWDRTMDVNIKGAFLVCQAAAPELTGSGRGRIVMISSDAGKRGVPWLHAYSASKFGVVGLTEALAGELAPAVTVNCVCPVGVPTTGMGQMLLGWKSSSTGQNPDEVLAGIARSIPMRRNATTADVAAAVMYFVSDAAGYLTGVALDVDGGARLNVIPGVDA
jgi:meso-butanediol dehydrogenase / (S,S)-butanediol dehydrogenase / diacetyl reductase